MFHVEALAPADRRWQEALSRVKFYNVYHTPEYQRFCAAMDEGEPFAWFVEKEEQILLVPAVKRRIPESDTDQFERLLRSGVAFRSLIGDQQLQEFTEYYHQTMRRQSAASRYYLRLDYFRRLAESLRESFQLFAIDVHERRIAMAICFRVAGLIQYHLGAVPDEAAKQSGLKALFFEIARWGRDQGCRTLHLGGGVGGRDDDGLFRFKQGFSQSTGIFQVFQAVLRDAEYERLVR
ncbi:MAG: GNAT family N-acetyltransferase, partial [Planctomycetota bacterium]